MGPGLQCSSWASQIIQVAAIIMTFYSQGQSSVSLYKLITMATEEERYHKKEFKKMVIHVQSVDQLNQIRLVQFLWAIYQLDTW